MAAFPTAPVLLFEEFGISRPPAVRRTEMDDLFVKQLKRASTVLVQRPVRYLVRSKSDYDAFLTWFNTTINRGADWFDWTDPYDSAVKTARILGGELREEKPTRKALDRWILRFTLEIAE